MARRSVAETKPESLTEYVAAIEEYQANSRGTLWYRGCSSLSYQLIPSLYRPRENPKAAKLDLSRLEHELVTNFRDRSLPYHSRNLDDNLETLFFMQHYSIPTRLLDWTENPFMGLFFALRSAAYTRTATGRVGFNNDAAVWVLDPSLWNQTALAHLSFTGGPLDPQHTHLTAYRSLGEVESLGRSPVALYGAHNSPRIVTQQGTFVIFGSDATPMEDLYTSGSFPNGSLSRVTISRRFIGGIRRSLFQHGFTEGSAFPDLEGLGRDLKRALGFES